MEGWRKDLDVVDEDGAGCFGGIENDAGLGPGGGDVEPRGMEGAVGGGERSLRRPLVAIRGGLQKQIGRSDGINGLGPEEGAAHAVVENGRDDGSVGGCEPGRKGSEYAVGGDAGALKVPFAPGVVAGNGVGRIGPAGEILGAPVDGSEFGVVDVHAIERFGVGAENGHAGIAGVGRSGGFHEILRPAGPRIRRVDAGRPADRSSGGIQPLDADLHGIGGAFRRGLEPGGGAIVFAGDDGHVLRETANVHGAAPVAGMRRETFGHAAGAGHVGGPAIGIAPRGDFEAGVLEEIQAGGFGVRLIERERPGPVVEGDAVAAGRHAGNLGEIGPVGHQCSGSGQAPGVGGTPADGAVPGGEAQGDRAAVGDMVVGFPRSVVHPGHVGRGGVGGDEIALNHQIGHLLGGGLDHRTGGVAGVQREAESAWLEAGETEIGLAASADVAGGNRKHGRLGRAPGIVGIAIEPEVEGGRIAQIDGAAPQPGGGKIVGQPVEKGRRPRIEVADQGACVDGGRRQGLGSVPVQAEIERLVVEGEEIGTRSQTGKFEIVADEIALGAPGGRNAGEGGVAAPTERPVVVGGELEPAGAVGDFLRTLPEVVAHEFHIGRDGPVIGEGGPGNGHRGIAGNIGERGCRQAEPTDSGEDGFGVHYDYRIRQKTAFYSTYTGSRGDRQSFIRAGPEGGNRR